jgi:hypothetical protein
MIWLAAKNSVERCEKKAPYLHHLTAATMMQK